MRSLFITIALFMIPLAHTAEAQDLSAVAFMSGCWRGAFGSGGTTIEESYTSSNTQVMLGTTRYIQDGRTVEFEFTRLHADSAGVFLTPYPGGLGSVSFRLTASSDSEAVFENLEHDFPKRIIYRRSDDGGLTARIEGDTNGREWRMARATCAGG